MGTLQGRPDLLILEKHGIGGRFHPLAVGREEGSGAVRRAFGCCRRFGTKINNVRELERVRGIEPPS